MAENLRRLQELGINGLASSFNKWFTKPATTKGKKSANKKSNSEDSDSSEYLLEDDVQGDSDDDDTESDEQPQPLAIEVLLLSCVGREDICIAFLCCFLHIFSLIYALAYRCSSLTSSFFISFLNEHM